MQEIVADLFWRTELRAQPAVSVSSNLLNNPADIGGGAWQAEWYADWRFARSWRLDLNVGNLIDSRVGFALENGNRFRDELASSLRLRAGIVCHY